MATKQEEKIIPVSKDKTYGLSLDPDRYCVVVYKRKLYNVDTQVPMKFNKTVDYKFYAAGEFGPWQLAAKPYQSNIEKALNWIYDMMVMDALEDAEDICKLVQCTQNERQTFIEHLQEISSSVRMALLESLK